MQYPTGPITGGSATVSFDVSYSDVSTSKGQVLIAFILDVDTQNYISGTASSSPDSCVPLPSSSQLSNAAVCAWLPTSSSGKEHATFTLQFSSHMQTYNLAAAAGVGTTAGQVVYSSLSSEEFKITAGTKIKLTVLAQGNVPLTIDGSQAGVGTASLDVDPGAHSISVPATFQIDNTTRLKFDHWEDGPAEPERSVDMDGDMTFRAVYVRQYALTLNTGSVSSTGAGWYDDDLTARFSVPSSAPANGFLGVIGAKLQFKGWYENGRLLSSSNEGTIQMNAAHTLRAEWNMDYTVPIAIVAVIVVAVGAFVVLRRRSR